MTLHVYSITNADRLLVIFGVCIGLPVALCCCVLLCLCIVICYYACSDFLVRRACCSHASDVIQPAVVQTMRTPTTNRAVRIIKEPSSRSNNGSTHNTEPPPLYSSREAPLPYSSREDPPMYSPADDPPSHYQLDI